MSATLVFLIMAASLAALIFRFRRSAIALVSIALVLFVGIGGGLFASVLGDNLQPYSKLTNPEWKSRNVIVVLGLGTLKWPNSEVVTTHSMGYSRIFEAARLYNDCKKAQRECKILASGGDPSRNGQSEAEVMGRELREIGVPESDLILETKSSNTFRNAQLSSEILGPQNFETKILVTSGFHLKRAILYFSHFSGSWIPAPSDRIPMRISGLPVTGNFMIFDALVHEMMGILRYDIYNLMGWNPPHAENKN